MRVLCLLTASTGRECSRILDFYQMDRVGWKSHEGSQMICYHNTDVTWNLSLVQSENERKTVVHKEERKRNRNFVRCNEKLFWLQQAFWFPNTNRELSSSVLILRMYNMSDIPGRRIFLCDVELGFGEHEFSGRRMSYRQRILQARLSWVINWAAQVHMLSLEHFSSQFCSSSLFHLISFPCTED